ncbi:hypothetical protein GYA93_09150 [Gordonia desulfuricans]|uniref:DUF6777 domain-containing protein n=1 Tax=Gordonia desulfuricans TaxID=89051 RepID=A0A7K3LNB3_9ACTN|nr:DUF6777 domain-containing protein [Gordonia desulfuricans]NDK89742.1 hypothetical protein [Gordonia desulfuricans]
MSYNPPGPPSYPPPSVPFGALPPEHQPRNRRNLTLILAAIVAVLALVFASVVVIVLKTKKDGFDLPFLSLTSAESAGENPFTPNASLSNKPLDNGLRLSSQTGAPDQGTRVVSGTTPGLYAGGSNTCDTAALGNYLANNPSQARAWASVFGISTGAIPYYLDTLTPVVLTADTWVTNYSYQGGSAHAYQDVLQAGTAVLVDGAGVPRVRCACGNPLAPPSAAPVGGFRTRGQPWPGYQVNYITRVAYNTQNVTVVNNTTTVINQAPAQAPANQTSLTLVNLDTRQLFERTVGGLLDLSGQAPLTEALPTPAALNVPLQVDDDSEAQTNGLARAGSPEVAPQVEQEAEARNNVPLAESENSSDSSDPSASAGAPVEGSNPVSSDASSPSDSSTSASSSSSAQASPTVFSGSGDSIGSFSFTSGSRSVTCRAPSEESTGSVSLTCSDSASRSVSQSSLSQSSVSSYTGSDGVWKLTLTEGSSSTTVEVTSATWQTLATTTTSTTTTETTVETTTPETTTTTETTTEETTTETTTEETTLDTTTTTTPAS